MFIVLILVPLLGIILLMVNLILASHDPYKEKNSPFECGFHSFLVQNRTQFNISFFIFALLFLLFDLEILLVYPYVVSAYVNGIYGLMFMLIFFLILTLGFAFELGKGALKLTSRQNNLNIKSINNISRTRTIVLKSQIWQPVFLFTPNLLEWVLYPSVLLSLVLLSIIIIMILFMDNYTKRPPKMGIANLIDKE